MRRKCFLTNCTNKTYGDCTLRKDVSFHHWPKDENIIEKWIQQCLRNSEASGISKGKDLNLNKYTVICSDHFQKDCFEVSHKQRRLKKGAIPTIFKKNEGITSEDLQSRKVTNSIPVQQRVNFSSNIDIIEIESLDTTLHSLTNHCNDQTASVNHNNVGCSFSDELDKDLQSPLGDTNMNMEVRTEDLLYQRDFRQQQRFLQPIPNLSNNVDILGGDIEQLNPSHHALDLLSSQSGGHCTDHLISSTMDYNTGRLYNKELANQPPQSPLSNINNTSKNLNETDTELFETCPTLAITSSKKKSKSRKMIRQTLLQKYRRRIALLEKSKQKIQNVIGKDIIDLLNKEEHMRVIMKSLKIMFEEVNDKSSELNAKANFLMSQLINFSKPKNLIRYDQWTIKYCIILQGRSPTLYEFVRLHNLLTIPSKVTLIAYTGKTKGQVGVTNMNKVRLRSIYDNLTQDYQKRVSLELDEMQCKSLLLWIPSRQEFVGQVDFGEVSVNGEIHIYDTVDDDMHEETNEILEDRSTCDPKCISEGAAFQEDDRELSNNQELSQPAAPILANSLINFLITGLTTKFSALVGSWPVAKLTSRQLYFLTIHVLKTLNSIGFIVDRVVGDNASINVKLFQLMRQPNDEDGFKIRHPSAVGRPLFLSYDYTHIIKNVRNQLIDRKLTMNGESLDFGLIRLLLRRTMDDQFHMVRFLSRKHVAPTNFERMKVKYAVDIFRPEVVAALRTMHDLMEYGFENVEPLCKFLERMWTWFCYHDICNLTQHTTQRLDIKRPFTDDEDERLKDLDLNFPEELRDWNKRKNNDLECFTSRTLDAIIFTSRSTANFVRYLLTDEKVKFVMTRRLSTDNIERFHGAIRHYCGSNDHPAVAHCLSAIEKISRTQLALTSLSCNTPLVTETVLRKRSPLLASERRAKVLKTRANIILVRAHPSHLRILDQLREYPVHLPPTRDAVTCVYVIGYTIHKFTQREDYCIDCYCKLTNPSSSSKYLGLIKHLDRGGLKYPAERVASRFWTILLFFRSVLPELKKCTNIVSDFIQFLVPFFSQCEEFKCSEDGKHSKELCSLLLKKFFNGVMRTEEKKSRIRLERVPIVYNKPQKRKVLKLQR